MSFAPGAHTVGQAPRGRGRQRFSGICESPASCCSNRRRAQCAQLRGSWREPSSNDIRVCPTTRLKEGGPVEAMGFPPPAGHVRRLAAEHASGSALRGAGWKADDDARGVQVPDRTDGPRDEGRSHTLYPAGRA